MPIPDPSPNTRGHDFFLKKITEKVDLAMPISDFEVQTCLAVTLDKYITVSAEALKLIAAADPTDAYMNQMIFYIGIRWMDHLTL